MKLFRFIRNFFRALRARRFLYGNLIEVLIHQDAILHNFNCFQKAFPASAVAPVLKSNAYGHDLVLVANILKKVKAPFLCIDSFFEAMILRNEGITVPLLILGHTLTENILSNKLSRTAFSILGLTELKLLAQKIHRPINIHLKIDTGMHRHGLLPEEIKEAAVIINENPYLIIEGVYTHLADADTNNSVHLKKQIELWNNCLKHCQVLFPNLRYFHCAATSGASYSQEIKANVMRLGLGLYGLNFGSSKLDLKPALEMRTKITSLKKLNPGDSIGYNATYTADRLMKVATISVGYAEGLDRRLSNKGVVIIQDRECPIIGRISMNITSLDVTDLSEVTLGDEVVVISSDPKSSNSVSNIAKFIETIPYEVLVHIPSSLRRTVV